MFGLTYCCTLWLNYNHRKRQQFICVVDINLQILKYCRSGGEQSHYLHLVAVVMRDADNDWWARAYRQRDVWGELVFFSLAARNINLYNLYQKSSVWCFAFSHTSTFELLPQSRDRPVGSLGDNITLAAHRRKANVLLSGNCRPTYHLVDFCSFSAVSSLNDTVLYKLLSFSLAES